MKKKSKIFIVACMLIFALFTQTYATDVSAASKTKVSASTKQKSLKAYKKLLGQYERKYGKAKTGYTGGVFYWRGVCFAKLVDFNDDGLQELVLAYQSAKNFNKVKYHVEMWTFNGKKVKKIASGISWTGNSCPAFGGFSINKYKGKYFLRITDGGKDYYYGSKKNGKLGLIYKFVWKGDLAKGKWYYNGKPISVNSYIKYYNKLSKKRTWYSFCTSNNAGTIRNQINKTKKSLNY